MTLRLQCWLFAIGSTLFGVGTAPGFSATAGAGATNVACFVGSWFFTAAAFIQLSRSGDRWRAEWHSAATQFVGTVLFDAVGAAAFLISGVLGILAVAPRSRDALAAWVNLTGCGPSASRPSAPSCGRTVSPRTHCWPTAARSSGAPSGQ